MKCQNQVQVGDVLVYVLPFVKKIQNANKMYDAVLKVQVVKKYNKVAVCNVLDVLLENDEFKFYSVAKLRNWTINCTYKYLFK